MNKDKKRPVLDWLKTNVPKAIQAVGGDIKDLSVLGVVKNMVRNAVIDKELAADKEKEFLVFFAGLEKDFMEMSIKDKADARNYNMEMQKSQISSWPARYFPYIMDTIIVLTFSAGFFYIAARMTNMIEGEGDLTPLVALFSAPTVMMKQVIDFHRGSSFGSKIKDFINKGRS